MVYAHVVRVVIFWGGGGGKMLACRAIFLLSSLGMKVFCVCGWEECFAGCMHVGWCVVA